jgi:hypothetical protein
MGNSYLWAERGRYTPVYVRLDEHNNDSLAPIQFQSIAEKGHLLCRLSLSLHCVKDVNVDETY